MRNSVIHGNRTLTRKSVTSSLRSASFPQWTSNYHQQQQHASLSVVAGASAAAPLTSSSSSSSSSSPSSSSSSQPLQLHQQQQDRWYRRKSAAAATIAGHHHPKRGGGSGGGSGHGGRRHPVAPNSNSSSSSRDKMNHASSSLNTRSRPRAAGEIMNVPFAYRAQQQQEQDPKQTHHDHHPDSTRRSHQQQHQQHQPQSYQDTSRFPRHQQPNFHRNGSRFPSSSSSQPFLGKNNRGGGGGGAKAAAAAAAKSDAMMKREQQEQEKQQIKQAKAKIQQTESVVVKLVQQDLVKLADQYRSILNSTLSDSDKDDDDDNRKILLNPKHALNNSSRSFALNHSDDDPARLANSLIQTIQETLDDIHQTGSMMEWSQIQETENLFRQVCTLLQETVRKSCHVHPVATSLSPTMLANTKSSSASHDTVAATIRKGRHGHAIISADDEEDEDEEEQDAVDDYELSKDWMDVAACCLQQLDILRTERTLMVEATRKWKSERPSKQVEKNDVDSSSSSSFKGWASSLFPSFVNYDKKMAPAATSARRSSVALLFGTENNHQNTEGNQEEQQQPPRKEYVFMAHEDISLGPTQGLFRLAIESIASTIPQRQQQMQLPQQQSQSLLSPSPLDELPESSVLDPPGMAAADETYRQALQPIATRLVQLFDLVPTDSTPDLTNVKTVLEITSLVGSLESARQCSRIFDTATSSSLPLSSPFYGSSAEHADLIPFTLVLRAYREAAKYEKDKHNRILVAQEVAKLLGVRWDRQLPRHKVQRIAQATIVLHCIAIVMARASSSSSSLNSETISWFCRDADNVFRRAVSGAVHDKFCNSILPRDVSSLLSLFPPNGSVPTTPFAFIDYRIFPLVNYWVRILALSGNADNASIGDDCDGFRRLEQAKRMICNMVEDEASTSMRRYMTLYPDVETVNAVIQGMVHRHRERWQHQQDTKQLVMHDSVMQDDLMVATKLLDFSMSSKEVGIWPNDETFGGMSALLTVLKPSNVGERLENLLDQMETRRYFSHRLMPITISLSIYKRVLWGLWQEALLNKTEPRGTSQRALTLLERLEMRSTPLWMSDDMVRKMQYSIAPSSSNLLYDLGLTPTKRTYELVLNACASTKAPSEFEKAALAAAAVVERMIQKGMTDGSSVVSSTLRTCGDRLPHDSNTRLYIESLLMTVDGDDEEDASESEKRVARHG